MRAAYSAVGQMYCAPRSYMIQGWSWSAGMHGVPAAPSAQATSSLTADAAVYSWNPPDAVTSIGKTCTKSPKGGIGGGGDEGGKSTRLVMVALSNAHKLA